MSQLLSAAVSRLVAKLANALSPVQGASGIGYAPTVAYASGLGAFLNFQFSRTPAEIAAGVTPTNYAFAPLDVRRYGGDPTGAAFSDAAFASLRLVARAGFGEIVFTTGTFKHASPLVIDWTGARVAFVGKVTLQFTGAGAHAVTIDGGAATGAIFDVQFGVGNPPIIAAPTATSGMFVRAVGQNSKIELQCSGALTRALLVNFAVCVDFKVSCSNNWLPLSPVPVNGIQLDARGAGELVSACRFYCVIEGMSGDGVVSTAAQLCVFEGTSEGNTGSGYVESGLSQSNTLLNMDNEANGGADYRLGGFGTLLLNSIGISTPTTVVTGARNVLQGSRFKKLNIQSTAIGTVLREVAFTAGSGGGNLTDAGIGTVYQNCYYASSNGSSPAADAQRKARMKNVGAMAVFSATQGVNCIVTIANNGLEPIDSVTFAGVGGMIQLNGNTYQVEPIENSNSFYILTAGAYVNSSAFGAFTTGGTATQVAFSGAWTNAGGALRTCGYKKDADGTVQLFGSVQGGATGTAVFTLPVGFRPIATELFACINSQVPELAAVTVTVAGVVSCTFATAALAKISLDNVRFMAEA